MFLLKKKGCARVSSAYGRFFPILVWGDTATSDNHKGGWRWGQMSAVTAIITQFYFYFAHLKST